MKPFNRKTVKPGDMLALVRFPSNRLIFKGTAFGCVIATWINQPHGRPLDVIVRQSDVLMVDAE